MTAQEKWDRLSDHEINTIWDMFKYLDKTNVQKVFLSLGILVKTTAGEWRGI